MGCPGGTLSDIHARFSGKKRTSMYISRQKLQSFSRKLKEKSARKARVNTDASISLSLIHI